jgi:cytochrome b6-f complex iron-sulfur subunit
MIVAVVIIVGVLLVAVLVLATLRRQDRESAIGLFDRDARKRDRSREALAPLEAEEAAPRTAAEVERAAVRGRGVGTAVVVAPPAAKPVPALPSYIDDETLGVTRRQFVNRSILALFGLSVTGFGASMLGFLWPTPHGGFGSKVNAGKKDDIVAKLTATKAPVYVPDARTYLNPFPVEDVAKAKKAGYPDPIIAGYEEGLVALYQKCVHLGCRVPWCASSQWFECPCHGSKYNRVGEKKGGPAPRGLDRFPLSVGSDGTVTIDTKQPLLGPPIGTDTTGQEAEGPHCH